MSTEKTSSDSASKEKAYSEENPTFDEGNEPTFEITIFTKSNKESISKHIELVDDGKGGTKPVSDGSPCAMSSGFAERYVFSTVTEVASLMTHMPPYMALAIGRMRSDIGLSAPVVAEWMLDRAPAGSIARTKKYLGYRASAPALMLVDFDMKGMPKEVEKRLEELGGFEAAMRLLIKGLDGVGRIVRASTSAGLYNLATGKKYTGSAGRHLYIAIKNGKDIQRALKVLQKRAWLLGLGWIYVSAAGSLLIRSIIDVAVGDGSRLIFEGNATLGEGLGQEVRPAVATEGRPLDSEVELLDLTAREEAEYERLVVESKRATKPEADKVIKAAVERDVKAAVAKGIPEARAREAAKFTYSRDKDRILLPPQMVLFDDPAIGWVTVGDILKDPKRFEGKTCADPLEVQGPNGQLMRNRAVLFIGSQHQDPMIFSQLHGGLRYLLCFDADEILNTLDGFDKKNRDEKRQVLPTLIKMLLTGGGGSISEGDEGILIEAAKEKSGLGIRVIKAGIADARKERDQWKKDRQSASSSDDHGSSDKDGGSNNGGAARVDKIVIRLGDHTENAEIFLKRKYMDESGWPQLFYADRQFYIHNGRSHAAQEDKGERVKGEQWMFLRRECIYLIMDPETKEVERVPVMPNVELLANQHAGLKALTGRAMPPDPSWLDGRDDPDIRMLLPMVNGILNLRTRELLPHSAKLFNLSGISYAYDREATCPTWDAFIASLETDRETIDMIEEMMGYFLTTDTRFHKIFAMYGPPRSGRGTLLRVFDGLTESMTSIPFRQLDDRFGFQTVIGKKVLAIPDLRVGQNTDVAAVNEMLISISGGDKQDIRRMNIPQWSGYLYCRIVFAANELQEFRDTSKALASRLLVLNLTKSFVGKEDQDLTEKLLAERPGILNRALAGLARLYARGRFQQPASGRARLDAQVSKADPNIEFINEMCVLETEASIETGKLFNAYARYAHATGIPKVHTKITFGRDFLSLFNVAASEARVSEVDDILSGDPPKKGGDHDAAKPKKRPRIYRGIRLVSDWEARLADIEGYPF